MLAQAALEAVKQWRYKPYFLNGEPVDVDTTINVNFTFLVGRAGGCRRKAASNVVELVAKRCATPRPTICLCKSPFTF